MVIRQAQAYRLQVNGGKTAGFVLEDLCNERYLMELDCRHWNTTVLTQMEPLYNLACAMAENTALHDDIFSLRQATEVRDLTLAAYQQKLTTLKGRLFEMQQIQTDLETAQRRRQRLRLRRPRWQRLRPRRPRRPTAALTECRTARIAR